MGDYIKELTIIDFLGMLVPGSVVIFILSMDYNIENFWNSVFGSESGGVVPVSYTHLDVYKRQSFLLIQCIMGQ